MALIKCPECGKEMSDKAQACIHCGCPLLNGKVYIKMPTAKDNPAFSTKGQYSIIDGNKEVLYHGVVGSLAEFVITDRTEISFKCLWGLDRRPIYLGCVEPGKNYQVIIDFSTSFMPKFRLVECQVIT